MLRHQRRTAGRALLGTAPPSVLSPGSHGHVHPVSEDPCSEGSVPCRVSAEQCPECHTIPSPWMFINPAKLSCAHTPPRKDITAVQPWMGHISGDTKFILREIHWFLGRPLRGPGPAYMSGQPLLPLGCPESRGERGTLSLAGRAASPMHGHIRALEMNPGLALLSRASMPSPQERAWSCWVLRPGNQSSQGGILSVSGG